MVAQAHTAAVSQSGQDAGQDGRNRKGSQRQGSRQRPRRPGQEPAQHQTQQQQGREQRAAQVVQHLPAADGRHRVDALVVPEDPAKQLPVATRPPMLAPGRHVVARGKLFDHLDVGGQPGTGEHSFEQVMAEQRVLRDPAAERRFKGIDIIDALARIGALAKEILVDVGGGRRVGIDAARPGEDPLVERTLAANRQRWRDARLENAVAAHDALPGRIEPWLVQRMGHLADQPQRGIAWQPRVGVEGDDVAHAGRHLRCPAVDGHVAGVAGAAQQPVQLMQLAALALPSHPLALHGVEHAPAVKQQKAIASRTRPMALV
ncbi:hypothetical protein D9M72_318020 [compost metagenome]